MKKANPNAREAQPHAAEITHKSLMLDDTPDLCMAKPGFETSMGELEAIVGKLESNELTLEESIALFEKGVALAAEGMRILDAGEKRVDDIARGGVTILGDETEEEL